MKKEFQILFKFSDVTRVIEAETEEEALKIADEKLNSNDTPKGDTYCYETEAEESK